MENRLREIRLAKKLSGSEVARRIGISSVYYYDLEKGKRRLNQDILSRLTVLFNVSIDYILCFDDKKNIKQVDKNINKDKDNTKLINMTINSIFKMLEKLDQAAISELY